MISKLIYLKVKSKRQKLDIWQNDYINFPDLENDYVYYSNRANVKLKLDDKEGACRDYKTSALMGNQDTYDWLNSWNGRWCRKMKT